MPVEGRGRHLDPKQIPQKDRDIYLVEFKLSFAKTIEFVSCCELLWAEREETFFLFFYNFYKDFSAAQPFLLQHVNNQFVHDFLSQQNKRLFLFLSELMDLFVAGRDQSAADQPNNLAEGHPPL